VAGTTIQPTGGGTYTIVVNGHTYHVTGQRPGSTIVVGGRNVTLPNDAPAPAAPATGGTYHPGTPFLTPDEQLGFNQQLDQINSSDIDLSAGIQQAHTNYDRTIVDLAHNALVQAQSVEESMASRGQYDSGIRSSALIDLEAHRALSADRAAQDLRAADILYETKHNALNTGRDSLQNWYTTTAGRNASSASSITPATPQPAPAQARPPGPAASVGAPNAHGAQGAAVLPPGSTHPGVAVPATATTYASGPPPGPGYQWNGVRWVKVH
jgi:hypothetical protein